MQEESINLTEYLLTHQLKQDIPLLENVLDELRRKDESYWTVEISGTLGRRSLLFELGVKTATDYDALNRLWKQPVLEVMRIANMERGSDWGAVLYPQTFYNNERKSSPEYRTKFITNYPDLMARLQVEDNVARRYILFVEQLLKNCRQQLAQATNVTGSPSVTSEEDRAKELVKIHGITSNEIMEIVRKRIGSNGSSRSEDL